MDFFQTIEKFINDFDTLLWGVPKIVILLGSHIYMTIRTKFVQRKTLTAIKLSVTKDPECDGDISPFQALQLLLRLQSVQVTSSVWAQLLHLAVQVRCSGAG